MDLMTTVPDVAKINLIVLGKVPWHFIIKTVILVYCVTLCDGVLIAYNFYNCVLGKSPRECDETTGNLAT